MSLRDDLIAVRAIMADPDQVVLNYLHLVETAEGHKAWGIESSQTRRYCLFGAVLKVCGQRPVALTRRSHRLQQAIVDAAKTLPPRPYLECATLTWILKEGLALDAIDQAIEMAS